MKRIFDTVLFLFCAFTIMAQNSFVVADKNGNSKLVQSLIFQQDAYNRLFSWKTDGEADGYQQGRDIGNLLYIARTNPTLTKGSAGDITKFLENISGVGNADAETLANTLKDNENIHKSISSEDGQSLFVKFKDDNTISVYPVNLIKDPFDEEDNNARTRSMFTRSTPTYKKTGSKGKVAVFNYFSNQMTRKTQNKMLEYMMQDLNDHDFGVEYYPYQDMTISNVRKVKINSKDYKAIIIITHGFTGSNQNSYFVIGQEYSKDLSFEDKQFIGDDNQDWINEDVRDEVPFTYRFWNEGFGAFDFESRYDCAVPVNRMVLDDNVILYMGSCNAYSKDANMHGTCIGWSGNNTTAQAHVTVLFYNLMRGKTLADALDIYDEQYTYYSITLVQTDTWKGEELTEASMKSQLHGIYKDKNNPPRFTSASEYYRDGHCYLRTTPSGQEGPIFLSNKELNVSFYMRDNFNTTGVAYPEKIYIKVTPLRSDAEPKVYSTKFKKDSNSYYKNVKIKLPDNGAYVVTAATDEDFSREILMQKPLVFVKAKPFKENSGVGEEVDDPDDETENIETFTVNGVSFNIVKVEGGSFMMGSPDDDPDANRDEKPQHLVKLSDFSIGETEVTQELWEAVMGNNPSHNRNASYPVNQITRDDCQAFFKKLKEITNRDFRLPTEAEWEYAARGGNKTGGFKYAGSNNINSVAWYDKNSSGVIHPVAQKEPNELGLYDMSGNVWEFCQDYYDQKYYSKSPTENPCNKNESYAFVMRGGGTANYSDFCRVTFRADQVLLSDQNPVASNWDMGIRLVLSENENASAVPAEAIDLGLPSGTLWASCNVGASKPEEFGGYYAWGETEEKNEYSAKTYKYCNGTEETCHDLGESICGTKYDVAYVKWGGNWQMPSRDQFEELKKNCTSQITTLNSVKGIKFTGSNGNSIFLPAAGERYENNIEGQNDYGDYFSGTQYSNKAHAYGFYFGYDGWGYEKRWNGHSVRPVYKR